MEFPSPIPALSSTFGFAHIIDYHAVHNAERPMAVFAPDDSHKPSPVTFFEFGRACQRFARSVAPEAPIAKGEVVALLANCDTIMYMTAISGLIRAGLTPFPISPRNSAEAVCHILQSVSVRRVLGTAASLGELLKDVQNKLNAENYAIQIDELPTLGEIYPFLGKETAEDAFEPLSGVPPRSTYVNDTVIYLHSSGSTGFPKSIAYKWDLLATIIQGSEMVDIIAHQKPLLLGVMALPTFHIMGLFMQLVIPLSTGRTIALYAPQAPRPPIIPNPANTLAALESTGSNFTCSVPTFIEIWAREAESIKILKKLDYCGFGGGPLVSGLGDMLVKAGVNLVSLYGGTEFGLAVRALTTKAGRTPEDWAYLELTDFASPRWVDQGNNTFELQFLKTDKFGVAIENLPDVPGYSTKDLFVPHPTKSGLWRITGRVDDVIMLASGEKTVPGPMEHTIAAHPFVQAAVMFGRERNQVGVIVEPTAAHVFDPSDKAALTEYRNAIWGVVEDANRVAPTFSRIFKEMILVASPSKPLPRTAKGTVVRKAAIALYESEIDEVYIQAENIGEAEGIEPPSTWTIETVTQWLLDTAAVVNEGKPVNPAGDLFEQGFDSLSVTSLRNQILHGMRNAEDADVRDATSKVGNSFVYANPTILKLSTAIIALVNEVEGGERESHVRAIRDMITHFTTDMPVIGSTKDVLPPAKKSVLITGTTGGLGSQLLVACLADEEVQRVYALNRPSLRSSIAERHADTFRDRGLDLTLLASEKLVYLEGEASSNLLGLDQATYDNVRSTVTTIIHNAWRLDFNLALSSFEPHVRGTRNLIDLALTSAHAHHVRFLFTSSIAVSASWPASRGSFPEEPITEPEVAVGNGYGEGKYVAEQLLVKAAEHGLQTTSFRIGQIAGGYANGAWATSDWVPIFVKSSITLGSLPDAQGLVSWIPFDSVARAVLDVADLDPAVVPERALNVVHPHPVAWSEIADHLANALVEAGVIEERLPVVPLEAWYASLRDVADSGSAADVANIPAVKLVDFFETLANADRAARAAGDLNAEAGGVAVLETEKVQSVSPTLRTLPPLGAEDVQRWVKYWVEKGLFAH